MDIQSLKANSEGQSLVDHLSGVMLLAYHGALHLGASQELARYAAVAGYLHDLGKCSNHFQAGLQLGFAMKFPGFIPRSPL